ncbi:MAG: hypothetical protein KatS3mg027_0331 [Bacteroidia bacterium]|nr:MAG: hypothetical protein KatS3mg027_0331 [Bacteroidia bacterium]
MEKLIKISSAIFLIVIILAIPCFKTLVTVNYLLKQHEITEKFCVNKLKPELQCHGKCFLKVSFNKINLEEKSQFNLMNALKNIVESDYLFNNWEFDINKLIVFGEYLLDILNMYFFQFSFTVYHPPTLV